MMTERSSSPWVKLWARSYSERIAQYRATLGVRRFRSLFPPQLRHAVLSFLASVSNRLLISDPLTGQVFLAAFSTRQRGGALQAINGTGALVVLQPEMLISAFPSRGLKSPPFRVRHGQGRAM
jgi:hypothetical protein